jgi:hypothetical protein
VDFCTRLALFTFKRVKNNEIICATLPSHLNTQRSFAMINKPLDSLPTKHMLGIKELNFNILNSINQVSNYEAFLLFSCGYVLVKK